MKLDLKKVILILVIILLFRVIYKVYVYNFKYDEWNNMKIVVEVLKIEKIEDEKNVYTVKYNNEFFLLKLDSMENSFNIGDKITLLSSKYEIKKYNNPYEFNYKRYLNSNNVVSVLYGKKILKVEKSSYKFLSIINYIRTNISNKLDEKLEKEHSNIIKSFMYGDDIYLDKELKEKFTDIGLGQILCVSGTHVSYLIMVFESITKSKKKKILNLIILVYFYIISFFKISLFRPICMYILSLCSKNLDFKTKLSISFFLVLIINPYYIFNIGIIFSFLSVLSINLFYSIISSWLNIKIKRKSRFICFVIKNISLTVSSQVLILPFQIYYFQKISLISIFSNLVICFILNIFMYLIFILFILFFIPVISDCIIFLCDKIIYVLITIIEMLYNVNYFNITLPKPNILVSIAFYIIIVAYLYKKLIVVYFWKYRRKLKKVVKFMQYLCIVYIVIWNIYTMFFDEYIIYFNVGQGNMTLLHNNTKNIIIDIGSTSENVAGNVMSNFLKAKNINKVDLILLTHMHSDHINGIEELIENNIDIKSVCYAKPYEQVDEYINLKKILKENNIGIIELIEEDNIKIGGVEVDILTPPKYNYIYDTDMLNANSTVYLITQNNKSYLFMGDSTKNTEKYILSKYLNNNSNLNIKKKLKNVNVYQVSHHGSNTSSYEDFIKEISGKNAIFSAKKSVYGHPSDDVVELFKKYNYMIFLTEKNGAIKF